MMLSNPLAERLKVLPSTTGRKIHRGRQWKSRVWTDAEAQHAADTFISGGPSRWEADVLNLLWKFLAITEERLYELMLATGAQANYTSFYKLLHEKRLKGLIDVAPESIVSLDLMAAGLKPQINGNSRYARVWTLGPVGRMVVKRLFVDQPFIPMGGEGHMAHHALATEVLFRFQQGAKQINQKEYIIRSPRDVSIWDFEKQVSLFVPDGMLIEPGSGKFWALEYHNEASGGRAKTKIAGYDELAARDDLWAPVWNIDQFPRVIVVWRHEAILKDYERALKKMAKARADRYGRNVVQFYSLSLADVLSSPENAIRLKTFGARSGAEKAPADNKAQEKQS